MMGHRIQAAWLSLATALASGAAGALDCEYAVHLYDNAQRDCVAGVQHEFTAAGVARSLRRHAERQDAMLRSDFTSRESDELRARSQAGPPAPSTELAGVQHEDVKMQSCEANYNACAGIEEQQPVQTSFGLAMVSREIPSTILLIATSETGHEPAKLLALERCMMRKATGCKEIARFGDQCFAVAKGEGRWWSDQFSTGEGETLETAENAARSVCEAKLPESALCQLAASECAPGNPLCSIVASGCTPEEVLASMNQIGGVSTRAPPVDVGRRPRARPRARAQDSETTPARRPPHRRHRRKDRAEDA